MRRGVTQDAHDKLVKAAGNQLFTAAFSSEPSEEEKKRHEAFQGLYEIVADDMMPQIRHLCIQDFEKLNLSLITAERTFGVRTGKRHKARKG